MVWQTTKDKRIKKRGDVYWARFSKRGIRVQESLLTQSFQNAVRMIEEIESCILLGVNWHKDKELFDTAWPDFLADKAKGIKTRIARGTTLLHYIAFGERYFLPFFKDKRLNEIDEELWTEYVAWVRTMNSTILFFNQRKYLLAFLSWAKKKGKINDVPDLFKPDARRDMESDQADGPGKAYADDEVAAMVTWAAAHKNPAFELYFNLARLMGMRSSEITQLKKDRIDWDKSVIRLRPIDTKTGQGRVIPIHPQALDALAAQFHAPEESEFLFPNRVDLGRPMDKTGFKKPWNLMREELKIEGRFHDMKHTFISRALGHGMNPVHLSKIVGTSVKVIERTYLHLTEEDLATEMSKFGG